MPLRSHNQRRVVLPVLSCEINFKQVPVHIMEHIRLRLAERVYNMEHVRAMHDWAQSRRMAPRREWYKDFGSFYLCGYGSSLATVLDKPKIPEGIKISKLTKIASFTDGILDGSNEEPDGYNMDTERGDDDLDLDQHLTPQEREAASGEFFTDITEDFRQEVEELDETHKGDAPFFQHDADWF